MTDKEPWFTAYRGPGLLRIVPCTRQGWFFLIGMVALVILPLPLVVWMAQAAIWVIPIYFALVAVVLIAMIRFAWHRAEVIDLRQMARDLKEFRKWRDEQDRRR